MYDKKNPLLRERIFYVECIAKVWSVKREAWSYGAGSSNIASAGMPKTLDSRFR